MLNEFKCKNKDPRMASRLEYIQYISIALLLLAIDVYFLFCAVIYGNLNPFVLGVH